MSRILLNLELFSTEAVEHRVRGGSNTLCKEKLSDTFTVNKDGSKITVNRTQLPLTLAYAFTDYRSQGQTLDPVIVDIGPPPYGHLTPFNIYIALSRGTRGHWDRKKRPGVDFFFQPILLD